MNTENEHDYFRITEVKMQTDKAMHVVLENNGLAFWVPKSLCEYDEDKGILEVEAWFAEKENWHQ